MTSATEGIEAGRFIGVSVARREDPRLLSGRGRYVDDVRVPGTRAAAFVRSPFARARIVSLDLETARAFPGVRAVLAFADLMAGAPPGAVEAAATDPTKRPLASGSVCFVGDPVALVVAESRAIAEDAAELVEVDYEPSSPLLDYVAGAADADLVHPELATNVAQRTEVAADAELEDVFAAATHVVTETFVQHRYLAVPMETRGVLASFDPWSGEMTVWLSTQGAHAARDHFAQALGLATNRVRVVVGDVGGGFGLKISVGREETAVVLAARLLGCPVKWMEDRAENLVAANHARAEQAEVSLALDAEGSMLAIRVDQIDDVGAYGRGTLGAITRYIPGPYRIPKAAGRSRSVRTNTARRGAYRGPWMFETVVRECLVDVAARRLGMDPLELRRRNLIRLDEQPYTTATSMNLDRVTPAETLEQAVAMLGYEEFRRRQEAERSAGRYLGLGLAVLLEPASFANAGPMSTDAVTIRVEPSGAVLVLTGLNSQGHSIETTIAQVVADELGVDLGDVRVVHGDTAAVPYGATTGGSRNAIFGGGAARQAAREMRGRVLEIAASIMEAAPEDLEMSLGRISVRGTPARSVALREVAELTYLRPRELPEGLPPGLEVASRFATEGPTWSNAAHLCTCEVDPRTGAVRLLRYIVAEDCGVMINPMVVEGQIAGGVAQGVGGVLLEEFVYDAGGNPLTTTLLDYLLPTAAEMPTIEFAHLETPSGRPGGFKGMGEGGAIAAPAAVFNAVADALSPFGVQLRRQPLTPAAVLQALREVAAEI